MAITDNAQALRDRAYQIWEEEGRPSGREHEHWAQAARELQGQAESPRLVEPEAMRETEDQEIRRLRHALYEPAEFSVEPFDDSVLRLGGAAGPANAGPTETAQPHRRLSAFRKGNAGLPEAARAPRQGMEPRISPGE